MIINIAHRKGGVGKSTLAVNLAVTLRADLLDLDAQHSSQSFNLIRESVGLTPFTCYTADTQQEILDIYERYQGKDKVLIVDSGGFDSQENRIAMVGSDIIISPVGPSQVEVFGLQDFENILRHASEEYGVTVKTNVLINNADIRSKGTILTLQKWVKENQEHFNLMDTIIHGRIDFKKSYGEGKSVLEMDPHSKASFEIEQLIREINKRIINA